MAIDFLKVMHLLGKKKHGAQDFKSAFAPAKVAANVYPQGHTLANDELFEDSMFEQFQAFFGDIVEWGEYRFIGYPALAMLQQDGLIQAFVETITEELGRKWVVLEGEQASEIEEAVQKFKLRKRFEAAAQSAAYQGGALLYIDLGVSNEEDENPLSLDSAKIARGSLKGFRLVEPYYVAPHGYQTVDPLADDFFKPTHWYVGGRRVHASRFLYFSWNTPLSILRPAYNFFGIPLPQLLVKYTQGFERARESGMRLIENFSLLGLKTDLDNLLKPGGIDGESAGGLEALRTRIQAFMGARNSQGMAVVDHEKEDLFQINTPLSGIEGLISQQFELPALISREPISKAFGTPPRGFNATGESDRDNFNDRMGSIQQRLYRENYSTARAVIELSCFGARVSDIAETWEKFEEPDPHEAAQINLATAQANAVYVQAGVTSSYEVRKQISEDPNSGFSGIDAEDVPPVPASEIDAGLLQPQAMQNPADAAKAAMQQVIETMQQKGGANG